MSEISISSLIAECTAYDFKLLLEEKRPKSWLKSVSAFANGMGGSLFFGIANDHSIVGLDDPQHVAETISTLVCDRMDPLPEVELIPLTIEGKSILRLQIHSGRFTPYYYVADGQRVAYVRIGDESLPATSEQMIRLVLQGTNRTYDSIVTPQRSDQYSFALLASTYQQRVHQPFEPKFLKSFGLVTEDGFMTNAGLLFADYCPLKHSRLYCTRWNGNEKDDAINDAEYQSTNILMLLNEGLNFIKSNTRKGWVKLPDRRKNTPQYAERAVLEALVNHLIHRDYTVVGGEIHLDIYENRLSLTSPGGMYNGKMIQDLDLSQVSSERRNPVIADVMAQLDYMEKRGSGLRKICRETSQLEGYVESDKPIFTSTSTQFTTTIINVQEVKAKEKSKEKSKEKTKEKSKDKILRLIQSDPYVTTTMLMEQTSLSESAIYKAVRTLRQSGIIRRQGGDHGGHWEVLKG